MMHKGLTAPVPLSADHGVGGFSCGEPSLDEWLLRRALKNQANGASRTYVVCEGAAVVGYCCLSAGALGHAQAPGGLRRNRPDPVPVMVLGRLAIHVDHQQRGIGTALLSDAIRRTQQAAQIAGISALMVHALGESARRFYRSRGFLESPVQPMTLCLLLETVRQA
jgi:ribosomal protein S18 acetylase RimI-like enzyme